MTTAALAAAAFFCSLTAGFLFGFAVVVMPGLRELDDGAFLRAFQLMDGVIQDNQPLFMIMWIGSIVALLVSMVLGFGAFTAPDRALLLGAGALYLGGVQLPTVTINIPLNNAVQAHDVGQLEPGELRSARAAFESRWNRWNSIRTAFACLSVVPLLLLLTRV